MTTKEKIAVINRMMDHLFDLSCQGKLSDDELQYLYNGFRHLRQKLREELLGVNEKVFKED